MTNPTTHVDVHTMVEDLTRSHSHREPYLIRENGTTWTKGHVTTVPALIHQLLGAAPAGSQAESGSTSAKSRPAARIESIDTLMLIDHEASTWIKRLGEDDPGDTLDHATRRVIPGSGTIACLTRLHALHASTRPCDGPRKPHCCTTHEIEHDIRRWWHQARIISGWDSVAWRPDNTCPICETRRALRVSLTSSTALCVECRSVWTQDDIGLLAEHIRAENLEDDDAPLAEGA